MKMALDIAKSNYAFTEGVRVLFLIHRTKDGGHTNNSKLRAYITRNQEQWIDAVAKLIQEAEQYPELHLRIYQTLNSRDIKKAIRLFKMNMVEADYFDEESQEWFYLDCKNRFISALMKKSSAAQSMFLFDIDSEDQQRLVEIKEELLRHTGIAHTYRTKNGWHIITAPFNPDLTVLSKRHLTSDVTLIKDGMMLLAY